MPHSIQSMYNIAGEVAVIAGAAGGIGRGIAEAMGELGVKLALIDIREDSLQEIKRSLQQNDHDVLIIPTDITNKTSVQAMAQTVAAHYGTIDILINSAGISYLEDTVTFAEDKWDIVMGVNVKGTFLTCQAVGKYMLQQKKGRIVNFSSVRGLQGRARDMAYAPSKGAINQLTKSLAIEWASENINVNAIAPTFTLTEMNRAMIENPATYQWIINRIPKKRLCELDNLVGPVAFLCSPCADFITGQILYVDGGWTAA
jgi:NAD(P)-dependent dehydrogenase (short-subunit alcohol dehydrogenase family)